ncbi:TonB-dependent hemoglobin/transferrin/lactoferrin family receptor [Neisseria perflava]|uniref:TonB-dependent hemoglobin/transferrin/lactoferrin family receptor n=3 Tax=Neisseria TaxID=482 RepID=A0ABD7EX47_NEIPE|nr:MULTISPECIES: TonB-dependent hemoglobin/transferrin/lactoferrin family receptor [Neisseria]QXW90175.1 TonB-dependent hemoglobin/transferrin/lactoferrin family receptor [Neisseria perflava]QXW94534.1 TonB-dependent hemoglobin/transferrin/lactoferrin family receptor [Neisseria sicca ATCC 29256]
MSFHFKPVLLAAIVSQTFPALAADPIPQAYQELNEVKVIGGRKVQKLGEEKIRRQALDKQMVSDESDLVRYDPGISVVEGGRSGSNGFTIRGVDKDRVAINVDGLAQAESRSSEAFQELFGAYGNFNANRNTSEPENFSEVTMTKGADSLKSGSGALGGAVNYKTKSASDYVSEEKPYHLGIKGGYIGRNSQKFSSITAAGTWLGLDALMVYTRRFGKETKNNSDAADTVITDNKQSWSPNAGSTNYGSRGIARSKPDPQNWENISTLFKLGYNFNDQNRIGWIYEDSRTDRTTTELSNMWAANWKGEALGDTRSRQDISYRKRIGFEYKNQLDKGPWDSLNLRYDRQTIDMSTWTWDLPTDYNRSGVNSDVYHMFRNIRQKNTQFGADAEKQIDFSKLVWAMQYGLGGSQNDNGNRDHSYWVRLYDPKYQTSNNQELTMLVESSSKNRFAYWNNTFQFGDSSQYRLNAGVRYDNSSSKAKDNPNYTPAIRGQIPYLGSERKHSGFSYGLGLDWKFTPHLNLLAKYSTGFRAPTSDETWLLFPHPDFYLKANPNLKAETAKNFELGLAGSGKAGNFKLSGFQTRYRNFIELTYMGVSSDNPNSPNYAPISDGTALVSSPVWQNQNRSSAWVKGLEFNGTWNLDSIGLPQGTHAGVNVSYIKGKAKQTNGQEIPINALSPWSAVYNLGYDAPSKRWGVNAYLTHTAAKKPSDTVHSSDDLNNPWPFAKHSKAYTLFDLTGYVNLGKYFTVRAGAYNIGNKKYYTWESLRSIREFGTVNRVDNKTHAGIERFTSPGRSYNFTLEAKF